MHTPRSQFLLLGGLAGLLLATACQGGTKSGVCKEYFERAEQCAARATPEKAEMLRGLAKLAREGFEDNQNKTGVEESCRDMLDQLNADPDCK
ncbi:MAG TPA: hypothetical protein VGB85_19030 [Nannocystis sp.]|jgi:hypothetical protein